MPKKDEKLNEETVQDETSKATTLEVEDVESTDSPVLEAETLEEKNDKEIENINTESTSSNINPDSDIPVTIQPVQFGSFEDLTQSQGEVNKNLDILMDIKLQLTVELGRTELPIRKVLELTRGSIIELEKVAGEPVELYANGKLVAHGEVVVIEDNFGLRITSITDPEDRLKGI